MSNFSIDFSCGQWGGLRRYLQVMVGTRVVGGTLDRTKCEVSGVLLKSCRGADKQPAVKLPAGK